MFHLLFKKKSKMNKECKGVEYPVNLQMLYLPEGFNKCSFTAPLYYPFVQEHVLCVEGLSERFPPGQPGENQHL